MTTRKATVIESAMRRSGLLIEALEAKLAEKPRPRRSDKQITNNRLIRDACFKMLTRRSPAYPSAAAISEECGLLSNSPPASRSINNRYADMHRIWREAYDALFSQAIIPDFSETNDFEAWDRSHLSNDERRFFDDLIRSNHSLRHKNNVLRQFVAENVPLRGAETEDDDELLEELENFVETVLFAGFELDDVALRTTRRVPTGAIVMERTLFDRLQAMVNRRNKTSKAARLLD